MMDRKGVMVVVRLSKGCVFVDEGEEDGEDVRPHDANCSLAEMVLLLLLVLLLLVVVLHG